jgi:hypothetical protein
VAKVEHKYFYHDVRELGIIFASRSIRAYLRAALKVRSPTKTAAAVAGFRPFLKTRLVKDIFPSHRRA